MSKVSVSETLDIGRKQGVELTKGRRYIEAASRSVSYPVFRPMLTTAGTYNIEIVQILLWKIIHMYQS